MALLPTGTVTFLFTDIEGSTDLVQRLGPSFDPIVSRHRALIEGAVGEAGGTVFGSEGDALFAVFTSAPAAVAAATNAQRALSEEVWPEGIDVAVRMGLHTGEGTLGGDNYLGLDVHRVARIAATGHGGQVVISDATHALVEHALPPGTTLRDLGRHRLKDLANPEHLYQLSVSGLRHRFPPLRTLDATPNNLPVQVTSFVGRAELIQEVEVLVGQHRLVTLTGPGGTGKTRLALEVAAGSADRFPDGVFFVPLASITDPELVAPAIVSALGLVATASHPVTRVCDHLANRSVLLVLDNFEQIIPAGGLVSDLLQRAPDLSIIVTSRAPLHVAGEQEMPVPTLPIPDRSLSLEDIAANEAVTLFVERAMAAKPSFSLTADNAPAIAEIAARLDGLPLAIELAAARVKLLPPPAIAARLESRLGLLAGGARDLPQRQQTLRDAIAWSYDLLDETARRLLRRMSVFVGGALLDQAEEVCGPAADLGAEVLDGLGLLVDQSLLRVEDRAGHPRFEMLETIREFAWEQLGQQGEAEELQRRHAHAYLGLVERAAPNLTGRERASWLDGLESEHDNLRAALTWADSSSEQELGQRLAAGCWRFWQMRGHLHEGRARVERMLAGAGGTPASRAAALEAAGGLAYWQGDADAALAFYRDSLALQREMGEPAGIADAAVNLCFPHALREEWDEFHRLSEEALAIHRSLNDRLGVGRTLWTVAVGAYWRGDYAEALASFEPSVELFRELDDPYWLGWSLYMVATANFRAGRLHEVRRYLDEAADLFWEAKDTSGIILHVAEYAGVAIAEGDAERGLRLAGWVAEQRDLTGTSLVEAAGNQIEGLAEAAAGVGLEEAARLESEGRRMTAEEALSHAMGTQARSSR